MTPQIPGYLLSFESIVRLLVTIIALGLIWLGAARMPASAKSRYATAGVLSAMLIGWVAVAQHLGAANTYFATADTAEAGMRAAPNQMRPSAMIVTRSRTIDSNDSRYPGIWGVMV